MSYRQESVNPSKMPGQKLSDSTPRNLQRKFKRKTKTDKQMEYCAEILKELTSKKHKSIAEPFYEPVDVAALGLDDYYSIVKHPMDLETIEIKLNAGSYSKPEEFVADIRMMFQNCFDYNPERFLIVVKARKLQKIFESKYAKMPEYDSHEDSDQSSYETDSEAEKAKFDEIGKIQEQIKLLSLQLETLEQEEINKKKMKKMKKMSKAEEMFEMETSPLKKQKFATSSSSAFNDTGNPTISGINYFGGANNSHIINKGSGTSASNKNAEKKNFVKKPSNLTSHNSEFMSLAKKRQISGIINQLPSDELRQVARIICEDEGISYDFDFVGEMEMELNFRTMKPSTLQKLESFTIQWQKSKKLL